MEQMPAAILDFAAALKLLGQSQSDVAEIVTKWDLICSTDTPLTVEIHLSNGVHKVDNLAKIRNDLIKGLSLNEPTCNTVNFKYYHRYGSISATDRTANVWHDAGEDPYEPSRVGWESYGRFMRVGVSSVCMPTTNDITVWMHQLEPVIIVGWATDAGGIPITAFDFHIKAMPPGVADSLYSDKQYYTKVTFVNTNSNGDDVTIKLWYNDADADGYYTRVLPASRNVTFLVWAFIGQDRVNIFEMKNDNEGAI